MINFKPDIDFVDPETIQISKHNGIPYLIITEPIHCYILQGSELKHYSLQNVHYVLVL
jgi:two-component system sensor histidine kinase ArlS